MQLKDDDLAPLFLPGMIRLPSPFPAVGVVEIQEGATQFRGVEERGALLIVRRRIWPSTKVCWIIRVELVSAILLTKGDELDPGKATWLFGPSVPKLKSLAGEEASKGIVFVPEEAPVLMRVEFGTTASDSADYPIPGLMRHCDPCDHSRTFSYESTMGESDKG